MPTPEAVPGSVSERPAEGRWNHNIHYGLELLRVVPASASVALDVGCGEGWLVRDLSRVVDHVIGVDPDEESVAKARSYGPRDGVEYVVGDFLTYPFERASFDLITSVAALHHMDEEAALSRMAELLRPSGTLAVAGLGRSRLPADLAWELAGAVTTRAHKLTKSYWETPAPKVWPLRIPTTSSGACPASSYRASGSSDGPCGAMSSSGPSRALGYPGPHSEYRLWVAKVS